MLTLLSSIPCVNASQFERKQQKFQRLSMNNEQSSHSTTIHTIAEFSLPSHLASVTASRQKLDNYLLYISLFLLYYFK